MLRRTIAVGLVFGMLLAACGDDESLTGPGDGTSAPEPSPTTTTGVSTTNASTTEATTTTAPPATTSVETTTSAAPSAHDSLLDFIGAAEALDQAITDAAVLFNEAWEPTGTITPEAVAAIESLDATPLRMMIPPGLQPELDLAVLGVFADLDSRISALHGAVRFEPQPEYVMLCLELGAASSRRFDADMERMTTLATASPPPTAAPDSVEAGILTVRLEAIQSMNWGCDSCGGVQYDELLQVDWEGGTLLDGAVDFDAEFDGTEWQILIYAC